MPSYSREVKIQGKSSQELYDKISQEISKFLEKTPIGKHELILEPHRKEVHIKSSMITATLICREESVGLDARLSLLAAPFRSKLDEGIDRWIAKTFNVNAKS